jgi:uncharacterized protein YbjT (DUF2867 family)
MRDRPSAELVVKWDRPPRSALIPERMVAVTPKKAARANSPGEILVAGVTGQQGGAVAQSLLRRGFSVRGLSRDPSKRPKGLDERIHWVQGNLQDAGSLEPALRGVDGFYIVTTPYVGGFERPPDIEGEVRAGTVALETAKKSKTPLVVLSTVMGIRGQTKPTGIAHLDSKMKIEQRARELNVPITIVRPSFFMENLLQPWMLEPFRTGTVSIPVKPSTKLTMVSVRDIGEIVARAFEHPDRRVGAEVELQGDSKTYPEIVELMSHRLGIPARFVEMSDEDAVKNLGKDMLRMYRGFDRGMPTLDIAELEREWDIKMTRFADLVKETELLSSD